MDQLVNFVSGNKSPENPGSGENEPKKLDLIIKIEELQKAYDGKITGIKNSLTTHVTELNRVKDLLQKKINDIEGGADKLKKEKQEALKEMKNIIDNINTNKSITDLEKSVDSVKNTSDEMKKILNIQEDEFSNKKDDYDNTFDATKTTILRTEDPGNLPQYGARILNDYFQKFPNSVFKNDVMSKSKITTKNLSQGELDGAISKYDEETQKVIKNLRNKVVVQYKKIGTNVNTQFGGYLSNKKRRRSASKTNHNYFRFTKNRKRRRSSGKNTKKRR
jgi:hypothetical protein